MVRHMKRILSLICSLVLLAQTSWAQEGGKTAVVYYSAKEKLLIAHAVSEKACEGLVEVLNEAKKMTKKYKHNSVFRCEEP